MSEITMTKEELIEYLKAVRESATDQVALIGKALYQNWDDIPEGTEIPEGKRLQCDDILWRCKQTHNKQPDWRPSISTASLFTAINEEHAGTKEDPIPVPEQMTMFEYEWGKYYLEGSTLYICDRQGGKDGDKYELAYKPSSLIGHYFSVAEA